MVWLSSIPSRVAIYGNRNRDKTTNQKLKFVKTEFGVATIVIIGNYGKPEYGNWVLTECKVGFFWKLSICKYGQNVNASYAFDTMNMVPQMKT